MPGYDVPKNIFEDNVDFTIYSCPLCSLLLKDPIQLIGCGCRFCETCADSMVDVRNGTPDKCPAAKCGQQIERQNKIYFRDSSTQEQINNLAVSCLACDWKGKFHHYKHHMNTCSNSTSRVYPFLGVAPPQASLTITTDHETLCEMVVPHQESCILQGQQYPLACSEGGSTPLSTTATIASSEVLSASVHELVMNQPTFSVVERLRSKDNENTEIQDCDFRLSLIENSNHDGSMIWKIPQFSQRKADAQSGRYTSIFSLPFYSGRYGYKMCLRLYIMGDGIGKGTHLSLFFVVMRGEFDNILQWPFTHKVTFKFLNQAKGRDIIDMLQPDPMSSSFRKPNSDMNTASGCPRFVSHPELERHGFIVDDTIFIKCMIDTSTIRHP